MTQVLLGSVAAMMPYLPKAAVGTEYTWYTNGSFSTWNDSSWWEGGVRPPYGGDPSLVLRIVTSEDVNYGPNDRGNPFVVNQLKFFGQNAEDVTLGSLPGNSLELGGVNPSITSSASSGITIEGLRLNPSSGNVTVSAGPFGNISLGDVTEVGGARTLIVDSPALVPQSLPRRELRGVFWRRGTVRLDENIQVSGGIRLDRGGLVLGTGLTSVGPGGGTITVNGGSVRLDTNNFSGNFVLNKDLEILTDAQSVKHLTGSISSATPGTGVTFRLIDANIHLSAVSPYSGATTVEGGAITLTNSASLPNTSAINVRSGAIFTTEYAESQLNPQASLNLGTATFHLKGMSGAATQNVTLGTLSTSGSPTIRVSLADESQSVTMTFASLARVQRGTFQFIGDNLGNYLGAAGARIRITAAPTTALVGGGGTGPRISILPFAIGLNSGDYSNPTFVTYSATHGVQPLNSGTDFVTSLGESNTTTNLRLIGTTSNTGEVFANSLFLDGGTLTGSGAITVRSGAVLHRSNETPFGNSLRFGTAEANIFALTNLTLNGDLSGTNGLTKSGPGQLTINGNNTISGPLTINSGFVAFSTPENLGASNSTIVINDTGAGLSYTGTSEAILNRAILINAGVAQLTTANQGGSMLTLAGQITGAGGVEINGRFRLSGNSSYTGPTYIFPGSTLTISGDSALGDGGALTLAGGLMLEGNWTTNRQVTLEQLSPFMDVPWINTNGYSATLNGVVTYGGGWTLDKMGDGILTLAGPTSIYAHLQVKGGAVRLAGSATISRGNTTISGGALELDNTGTASSDRLPDIYEIELSRGELIVRGNATTSIDEWTGPIFLNQAGNRITLYGSGTANTSLTFQGRSGEGYVLVRGDNLGGTTGTPYTRVNLFGNTILGDRILKGVFADNTASGLGSSFAVYDETLDAGGPIGIRGLRSNEYSSSAVLGNPAVGGQTPGTAHFLATGVTTATGETNSIQSLTLDPTSSFTLTGSQTLMLTTGSILSRAGGTAPSITGGLIDFGVNAGTVYTAGDLTIGSTLRGAAGMTKVGPGTLILDQTPAYPGVTTIAEGTLRPGNAPVLANGVVNVEAGAVLDLSIGAAQVGGLSGSGTVHLGNQTLTLGTAPKNAQFLGSIDGTGNVVIVSGGNDFAQRRLYGANSFSGGVTLNSGRLMIGTNGALGTGVLTVNGGSLAVRTNFPTTLNKAIVLNSDLRVVGAGALTLGSSSTVTGTGGLDVRTSTSMRIQTPAAYTGNTRVSFGALGDPDAHVLTPAALIFEGAGSALNSASIQLDGGAITLDNSLGNPTNPSGRLGDTTPIAIRSGRLELKANGVAGSTEVLGPISSQGFSTFTATSSGTKAAELVSTSLTREGRATFLFRGSQLGNATTPGAAKIRFGTAVSGLAGGGGTGPSTSILPFAIGGDNPSSDGTDLVTYDPVNGVRLLGASEYLTTTTGATSSTNVKLSGTPVVSGNIDVNALVFTGSKLSGTGTLRIASGTLLATGYNEISANLDFGTAEANVFATSALSLSGTISGTGGLTKSGPGSLHLRGQTTLTGPLTLNSGVISITNFAQLGADTSAITVNTNGVGAGIELPDIVTSSLTRDVQVDAGLFILGTGGTLQMLGSISGPGGVRISQPGFLGGNVSFPGANSYSGPTVLQGGLAIASDASLGNGGAIVFASDSARLVVNAPWVTNRIVDFQGGGTIDTNGNNVRWDGPVVSKLSGSINKVGNGTLTLTGANTFEGSLSVRKGAVQLAGAAALELKTLNLMSGGELILDNSGSVHLDRIANDVEIRLSGAGRITLKGNESIPVFETLGTLDSTSAPGTNIITLDRPGSASVTLGFSSYEGDSFSSWTTFRGQELGGSAAAGYSRVTFARPPSQYGLIVHALVDHDINGTGNAFAVYDKTVDSGGVIGVRAIRPEEYSRGSLLQNVYNGGQLAQYSNYLIDGATSVIGKKSSVNSLTLANNASLSLQRDQELTVSSGGILAIRGSDVKISGGTIKSNAGNSDLNFLGDGNITLSGVRLPSSVKKLGMGDLTVENAEQQGAWDIMSGRLKVMPGNSLAKVNVTLAEGAQIVPAGNIARVGSLIGNGQIALGEGTLSVNRNPNNNGAHEFRGTISGSGNIAIQGEAQWRLLSPAAHTGATLVGPDPDRPLGSVPPKLTLAGGGMLRANSTLLASGGGIIELANDGSNPVFSRIGEVPVTLNSGTFVLKGDKNLSISEEIGTLTVSGHSRIEVTAENLGSVANGSGAATTLNATSLTRSDRGTFTLSLNSQGSLILNPATLKFTSGLSSLLVGANTNATNRAILPFAVGNASENFRDLLTYEPGIGVRPLLAQEYASGFTGVGENVRTMSSTVSAPQIVNSLLFNGTLFGPGSITVNSGTVVGMGTIAVPLNFEGAEGIIMLTGSSTISGSVTGSNGLTVSAVTPSSTLSLTGTNTLSGPLTLNGARLDFANVENLGISASDAIVLNDAAIIYRGAAPISLANPIRLTGYQATLDSSIASLTIPGTLSGPGGVNIMGTAIFTGENKHTGLTKVSGKLTIDSDAALGKGSLLWLDGVLALNGSWETNRALHVSGSDAAVIDTDVFDATLHGTLTAESVGDFVKKGSGILRIDGDGSGFLRPVTIEQGSLIVNSHLNTDKVLQVKTGATLGGTGEINDAIALAGNLSPGDQGTGTLSVEGLTISAGSGLMLEITSATAFDQVCVNGSIALNGQTNLSLTLRFDPADGVDSWVIIDNDGIDQIGGLSLHGFAINGTMLSEGAVFQVGDQSMRISYKGGTGNDVVLSAVPEPSSTGLFAIGGAALLGWRRKRRK